MSAFTTSYFASGYAFDPSRVMLRPAMQHRASISSNDIDTTLAGPDNHEELSNSPQLSCGMFCIMNCRTITISDNHSDYGTPSGETNISNPATPTSESVRSGTPNFGPDAQDDRSKHSSRRELYHILRLIIKHNPYGAKHGQKESTWKAVLRELQECGCGVGMSSQVLRNKAKAMLDYHTDDRVSSPPSCITCHCQP